MAASNRYSDRKLLRAVRTEGEAGWELFCDRFDPLIRAITGWSKWNFSEDEQEDVRQEIYVRLQTALPNFQQKCSLKWFIKKISIHQCVNEIRRQVRWRKVITPSVQKDADGQWNEMEFKNNTTSDPRHEILQKERIMALSKAMGTLQSTCKNSITLFYIRNLSYREMADQLGVSVNTVGSRLSKCLSKLHRELRHNPLFERMQS